MLNVYPWSEKHGLPWVLTQYISIGQYSVYVYYAHMSKPNEYFNYILIDHILLKTSMLHTVTTTMYYGATDKFYCLFSLLAIIHKNETLVNPI